MSRLTKLDRNVYHPTPTGAQFLEPDDGSNAARLLQVIGKYEDIEEDVGCPVETVFKALKNGVYTKKNERSRIVYYKMPKVVKYKSGWKLLINGTALGLKECGKTWALTKEELQ